MLDAVLIKKLTYYNNKVVEKYFNRRIHQFSYIVLLILSNSSTALRVDTLSSVAKSFTVGSTAVIH